MVSQNIVNYREADLERADYKPKVIQAKAQAEKQRGFLTTQARIAMRETNENKKKPKKL